MQAESNCEAAGLQPSCAHPGFRRPNTIKASRPSQPGHGGAAILPDHLLYADIFVRNSCSATGFGGFSVHCLNLGQTIHIRSPCLLRRQRQQRRRRATALHPTQPSGQDLDKSPVQPARNVGVENLDVTGDSPSAARASRPACRAIQQLFGRPAGQSRVTSRTLKLE